MIIPDWTPSDAVGVNEFLKTAVGKKWLEHLANAKPRIDTTSTEKAALSGAYAAGYEAVLSLIKVSRGSPAKEDFNLKPFDPTRD